MLIYRRPGKLKTFETRIWRTLTAALMLIVWQTATASAQDIKCGEKHTVSETDTLNSIAQRAYGQANKWTLIYYANQKQFGNSPILVPGNQITIPCLKSAPLPAAASKAGDTEPGTIAVSRIGARYQAAA